MWGSASERKEERGETSDKDRAEACERAGERQMMAFLFKAGLEKWTGTPASVLWLWKMRKSLIAFQGERAAL